MPLHTRRRVRTPSPIPEPDTEKGNELLNSGEFGRVESAYIPSKDNKKNVTRKLWMRQLKPRTVNPLSIGEVMDFLHVFNADETFIDKHYTDIFPSLLLCMISPSYLITQAKWSMHMENLLILANTQRTGMSILLRSNATGSKQRP